MDALLQQLAVLVGKHLGDVKNGQSSASARYVRRGLYHQGNVSATCPLPSIVSLARCADLISRTNSAKDNTQDTAGRHLPNQRGHRLQRCSPRRDFPTEEDYITEKDAELDAARIGDCLTRARCRQTSSIQAIPICPSDSARKLSPEGGAQSRRLGQGRGEPGLSHSRRPGAPRPALHRCRHPRPFVGHEQVRHRSYWNTACPCPTSSSSRHPTISWIPATVQHLEAQRHSMAPWKSQTTRSRRT